MIILSIESTTNICSTALSKNGKVIAYLQEDIPQRQLTWIMPAIDKILKKSRVKYKNIDYIAVTNGPGSYTGLRLGIITAKTLAQILDIPIIAYNTLEALAYNCVGSNDIICAALDAKKNEIYAGVFVNVGARCNVPLQEQILPPKAYELDELICGIDTIKKMVAAGFPAIGGSLPQQGSLRKKQKNILLTGTALYKYKDELSAGLKIKHKFAPKKFWHPKASALCEMAYRDIVGQDLPLRDSVGQAFRPANNKAKLLGYADLQAYYLREPDIGTNRKMRLVKSQIPNPKSQ